MNDKIITPTADLISYYESIKDSTTTLLTVRGYIKSNCFKSLKSRLSKDYWVVRGYTEIEAKEKVSELQRLNVDKVKPKTREQNPMCIEYYLAKGYSKDDAKKLDAAKAAGYTVLHIWESDWKADKQACINTCIKFLNEDI